MKCIALSPNTLNRLVEEQTKSHEAIEALQQRIQATTPNTSDVRKELEQIHKETIKRKNVLNQILDTPVPAAADNQSTMLAASSDVEQTTPLAKKLFLADSEFDDDVINGRRRSPGYDSEHGKLDRRDSTKRNKKSDTDNDTGVESDTGSDPGGENDRVRNSRVTRSRLFSGSNFDNDKVSPMGKTTISHASKYGRDGDELLMYLEIIEQKALAVESLIEQAKLDTVLSLRKQIEAEFNGLPLQEIPAKCHQKIDRAIQRFLEQELEKIRAEYENKYTGNESSDKPEGIGRVSESGSMGQTKPSEQIRELERENENLQEKIESLETSVNRVDMLYLMQKRENEYLTEKVTKLERQLTNEKLKYENELHDVKNDFEERGESDFSKENGLGGKSESEAMTSLYRRLEQQEKQNRALKIAGDADQTTIRCLEGKVSELEQELSSSRQEVNDLLQEIRDLQSHGEKRERKLHEREVQLKEVNDERRVLRETLIMSEHEISLLENKLGNENTDAWKDSKKEILEELRKLEKHIKVIHKEKRKLENKYLAFKIENEHLSDSLHSFGKTKDILTPLGSCDVSRNQSTLSSHSSSLSSSLAGSDVEDEEIHDTRRVSKDKVVHATGRRRKRNAQDQKDKKFAEAVARKLMFAQQVLKDQNCNFSSFENSGEDLINEADQLVKRVDSLQAEKRAIKMELESIRSTQPENVKC